MDIKTFLLRCFAYIVCKRELQVNKNAIQYQKDLLSKLIDEAKPTKFGIDHHFNEISNYSLFKSNIPLRSYEEMESYFELAKTEKDIIWKDRPLYWAKTSGTISGSKLIPISKESIGHHIVAARNVLLFYLVGNKNSKLMQGKMMFLQGSPELEYKYDSKIGRLSGIVYHHVPRFFLSNRLPSYPINIIEDWEKKLEGIVDETKSSNMTLIGGIPPWVVMYFEKLIEVTGCKKVTDQFVNLELYIHGGVSFSPYKEKMKQLIGGDVAFLDTYPASEGFIAYQIDVKKEGLLLNINAGIFYEFIELKAYQNGLKDTIGLQDVLLDVNYVIVITTNAGLWRYIIGDTIKFISIKPYLILVTGRIKQFISAFGEHVIAEEVEDGIQKLILEYNIRIVEFHVFPEVQNKRYNWAIEFEDSSALELEKFGELLHDHLKSKNIYYRDLAEGNLINLPIVTNLPSGTFNKLYKKTGKMGGQNKVNRLSNNDEFFEQLKLVNSGTNTSF